jgi:2',3'-cyclic-nucleotide 2'-phosphodiesterase/3'-nucleotidase
VDTLRLIVTSDTHGGLSSGAFGECALPRLSSAIVAARGARPALLLDNGDTFFGGPLVDDLDQGPVQDHAVARCLASFGYAAINVGNEDLRLGLGRLEALARAHALPIISTNVVAQPAAVLARSRVLTLSLASGAPLKVGVLGTVAASACHGPEAPRIEPQWASLASEAARLAARGCEIVVALCHTGMRGGTGFPEEEAEAISLASVPGVAAIVAGHLHEVGTVRTAGGVPVVAPGSHGRHLGLIDFDIERGVDGRVRATCVGASVQETAGAPPDARIERLLAPALDAMRARQEGVLGFRRTPLTTEFAPAVRPSAVRWMTACLRGFVADTREDDDAIIAAQCAGGRGLLSWITVSRGPVRTGDLARLFPYQNTLELAEITGATLLVWLEASASRFHRVDSGADAWQPLQDESVPLCDHDWFSDVDHAVDLCAPPGARVRGARWRGCPIEVARGYRVAIGSYRLARLARLSSPRSVRTLAPCVRTVLLRGVEQEADAEARAGPRLLLPPGARSRLYLRARAPAHGPLPPGIRRLEAPPGAALYGVQPTGGDS